MGFYMTSVLVIIINRQTAAKGTFSTLPWVGHRDVTVILYLSPLLIAALSSSFLLGGNP